jgi:hypothetical protein
VSAADTVPVVTVITTRRESQRVTEWLQAAMAAAPVELYGACGAAGIPDVGIGEGILLTAAAADALQRSRIR